MRLYFLRSFVTATLISTLPPILAGQWTKAVVRIESIIQRYNPQQVDQLLQKHLSGLKKGISQHETFEIRDSLESITDTIRGTGTLMADGAKLYLVTAKHLVKATAPFGNTNREVITNLLTIHLNGAGHKTNDINLSNLIAASSAGSPVVFSGDETDLVIISLQQTVKRHIVAYIKQNGAVGIPIQNIANSILPGAAIATSGYPALKKSSSAVIVSGKVKAVVANKLTVALEVYPGNSGGPLIYNNKLAGVLSYQSGINNNIDAAWHPFEKAVTAKVIKSSAIIRLLKSLKANELNPAFNY